MDKKITLQNCEFVYEEIKIEQTKKAKNIYMINPIILNQDMKLSFHNVRFSLKI